MIQLLVLAKAPVPGRVKTRLCPPCTPVQAAAVAAASLADTLAMGSTAPVQQRTIVLSGEYEPPRGWAVVPQRGDGLDERIAHAFADTARPGLATVLVGMDTPQLDVDLLAAATEPLERADAVLAPAEDGGWWALALREPHHAAALRGVPMSQPYTYVDTRSALLRAGLTVASAPTLRDVDTAEDAWTVARERPDGRFAAAVQAHVPLGAVS